MTIRDLSIATIDAQCAKGLAKYGKLLDDAHHLDAGDMAQHLVEELADGLQYGVKLLQLVKAQQDTITALREENHRLKSALAPILDLAKSFTVEVPAAPPVVLVSAPEPIAQPVPVPSPAAASLPQIPNGEIPEGCITSAQAQEIMGVGRSSFSNYKQSKLVTPAGKVRLKGGQWSDFYRRSDIERAAEKLKARTAALELKPVKPGPITVYNSTSLGHLLGLSVSGVSFAVKAGRLTPREGTGTGSGNPYLFDITDPVAFKANYEAKTHASRAESAQKAGKARADQSRQRREQSPTTIEEHSAPTPTPKEVYPETTYSEHLTAAKIAAGQGMQAGTPFGLIFHATRQEWAIAPLVRVEEGWSFVLRLERSGLEWVPTIPMSCRSHWTGKVAADVLAALRESGMVKR